MSVTANNKRLSGNPRLRVKLCRNGILPPLSVSQGRSSALSKPVLVMFLLLLILPFGFPSGYGQSNTQQQSSESGASVYTDRPSYTGNATIVVSGVVPQAKDFDVTVTIKSPSGVSVATADQTADEDTGGFTVAIKAGGQAWSEDGMYTATVVFFPSQRAIVSASAPFNYATSPRTPTTTASGEATKMAPNPLLIGSGLLIVIVAVALVLVMFVLRRNRKR